MSQFDDFLTQKRGEIDDGRRAAENLTPDRPDWGAYVLDEWHRLHHLVETTTEGRFVAGSPFLWVPNQGGKSMLQLSGLAICFGEISRAAGEVYSNIVFGVIPGTEAAWHGTAPDLDGYSLFPTMIGDSLKWRAAPLLRGRLFLSTEDCATCLAEAFVDYFIKYKRGRGEM